MSLITEENPFENEEVARQWIKSVETVRENYAREKDIYPLLRRRVDEYKPESILEIGSGQGICASHLGENFNSYIGLEPSAALVNRAEELYKDSKRSFVLGNAYELPFENNHFSFVFSVMVWFHLKDLDKATAELSRVLKDGGHFLIITAHPDTYNVWASFFDNPEVDEEKIIGSVQVPGEKLSKNIIYKHSKERYVSSLERAGLHITRIEGLGYKEQHGDDGIFILIEGTK